MDEDELLDYLESEWKITPRGRLGSTQLGNIGTGRLIIDELSKRNVEGLFLVPIVQRFYPGTRASEVVEVLMDLESEGLIKRVE